MCTTRVGHQKIDPKNDNIKFRNIHETNPELSEFIERNTKKNVDSVAKNDPSKIIEGANYRLDAIRFSYKIFAKTHLMLTCDYDYVFWIDADIVFKKTITEKEVIKKFYLKINVYHLLTDRLTIVNVDL